MNRMERAALIGGLVAVALVAAIPATSSATTDPPPPSEPPAAAVDPAAQTTDSTTTVALAADAAADTTTTSTADTTSTTSTTTTSATTSTTTTTTTSAPTSSSAPTVVPPSEPVAPVASPGNAAVTLSWGAPVADGGAPITDYVVERSPNGSTDWATAPDATSPALTATVSGLTNGATHYFRVRAVNIAGSGPPSSVVSVVPRTVPSAPRTLIATPTNVSGQVRLSWVAPASNGGTAVTDYAVQRSPNGTSGWVTITDGVNTATAFTVSGLANGTRYYFRVLARNAVGYSPSSNVVNAIPRTIPAAVRSLSVTPAATGQLRLAWLAPASNGGSAITDYLIQRSPNGTTGWVTISDGVSTATAFTVTGLRNGTRYYFRVFPRNAAGYGPASTVVSQIPRPVPTAVRSLTAGPTNVSGQVRLTWVAPASNGGYAVTDYVIQRWNSGAPAWVTISDGVRTTTTYTVTGLANGTRYYFRVFARNAAGYSLPSPSVLAIPRTVPTAPRSLTAAPTNVSGQVRLTWVAPASSGGSAVTDYLIQRSPNGRTGWVSISDGVRTTTTHTVTGLANGTRYYFRVFARNAAGYSPTSAVTNAVPRTVPGAPLNLEAFASFEGYLLLWDAPANNGSPITDYIVQVLNPGNVWETYPDGVSPETEAILLISGFGCDDLRVAARNAAGIGAFRQIRSCFLEE